MPQRRICLADAVRHFAVIEAALGVWNDARRGSGKLRELADLGVAVAGQRGDWNAADFLKRKVKDHKLGHVGQLHYHAVERLEAQDQQIQREVFRETVELGV